MNPAVEEVFMDLEIGNDEDSKHDLKEMRCTEGGLSSLSQDDRIGK